jgi:hypothetical protein
MEYRLFADPKKATRTGNSKGGGRNAGNSSLWESNVPLLATGLVLADDTLFAAGAPDVLDETQPGIRREPPAVLQAIKEQEEALAGKRGGVLVAVSRDAGDVRHRYDLDAPPVFDGLIAANGRLYLALKDGTIQCWRQ